MLGRRFTKVSPEIHNNAGIIVIILIFPKEVVDLGGTKIIRPVKRLGSESKVSCPAVSGHGGDPSS